MLWSASLSLSILFLILLDSKTLTGKYPKAIVEKGVKGVTLHEQPADCRYDASLTVVFLGRDSVHVYTNRLLHSPHYENVPNGWAMCSVKDIAQVITGSTPSKSNSTYYGNEVPFYKPNDLDCGRHVSSANEYLSLEGKRISRVIPCNSVSICCIGSIGKVGYIETEGVTNQQINTIIPSSEINTLYIYYYCLSERFQHSIKNESSAVTIAIVNKSKLEKLSILLPPKTEQERIVEKIEQLMCSLNSIAETLV